MSVIIRLQNLPWSANALDIREFFKGLQIPEGGVHIVGGEQGDAFIAFGTDEDARLAMQKTGSTLKGIQVTLLLSSRSEMQKVIESARQQAMALQGYMAPPAPASIPAQKPQQTMPPQQQQQPPPSVGQMHPYQPQQPASHMPYPSAMHQMSPDARHSQLPPHMQPQSQGHLMQTPPMSNASSNNNQMHSGHGQMHGHGGVDSHGQNHLQHSSVNQADKKDDKKDSSSSKRDSKGRDGRRRRSKSRSRSRSRSRDRDRRRRHRTRSRSRSRDRSGRSRRRSRSRERDRGRDRTRDRNDRDKDRAARPGRDRSERDSQDTMEAAPLQESHPKEGNNGGIPGLGDIPSASMRGPLPSSLSEPPKNSPIHTPSPASTPAYNTAAPFSANNPYSAAPPFGQTFNFMNIPPPNMVGSTKFPEVPEMDQDEESQMSREAAGSDYLADQMMSHKSEQMYGSRSDKMQSGGPMDGMAAHRPESTGLLGDAPGELPHGAFAGRGFAMSRGSDAFGYDRGPGTRPSSADGRNSDFDSRNRDGRMGGGREFRDSRGFREMDMRDGRGPRDKDSRDDREMREDSDRRGWGPRGDMRGERGNRWDTQEDHDAGWGRGRDSWNGRGDRDNWSGKGGRDSRDSWNEHDGWAKQEEGWEDHEGYYPEEDEEENYDEMYESMGRGGYRGGRGGMRGWERGRGRGRGFGPRYGEYREGYQEGYPDDGYGGHRGGYRGGYRGRGGGPGPYREGGEGGGGGGDKPKYTCSVEIRNIPQGTSYRAIRELFHGIYVPNNSIKLLGDDQGNRLNIALLKFSQPRDALKAVRCSGKYLYDNQVEIKFLTDAKYEAAVDVNQMQGKLHSGGKSGSGGYDEKLQDSSCICVSGLPNGSTENDVAHVFSRCKIIDIVLERDRNSRLPTGRCFVRVQSSDEAQRAVDALSGNAKIGSSQLEIELCSLESMMAAKGIDSSENSSNQSKSLADQKPINSQQGKGMETHNGDEGPGKHTPLGADLLTDSVVMKGVPKDTSEASIRDFFSDEGLVPEEVHFCEPLEDGVVYVMFPLIQDARRAVGKSQQQLGKVKVQVDLIAKPVVMTALGKPFDPLELIKKGQDSLSKGDLNPDKSSSDGGAETSQDSLKIDSENQSNDSQKDETEDMYEGGNLSKAPLIREPLLQHGQSIQDKDSRRDDKPPRFDPYSGMGGMPRGPYRGGLMGHYPGAPRGFRPRGDMRGGMHRMPGGMRDPGGFNRMRGPYPMMRDSSDPSTGKDAMGTAIPPEKFGKPGCVVALGNVSYRATTDDILDFFHEFTDLRPQNVIRRYNEFNQPTADARVSLTSAQDAQRALKTLHRQFMCNRQIFLSLVQE